MVDVVVESGRVEVVVVLVVAPLKWGPTTDPTNPAKASARQARHEDADASHQDVP